MFKLLRHIIVLALLLCGVLETSSQMAMPDHVCVGTTKKYSVNDPSVPSTYTWKIDGVTQTTTTNEITITWNTPGQFLITVQERSADGCDGDIQSGIVYVYPPVATNLTVTICEAELPFTWNGQTLTEAGTATATLQNINGCDSVVTLTLTVNPNVTGEETVTICEAALPYSWNGTDYNTAGVYTATLTGANGCDSIATLHLIITPIVTGEETVTVCEVALPYSWNGTDYNAAGDYTATLTGANGCDSIATLHLVITPVVTGEETVTICEAALPYSWNGTDYNAAGDYTATLTGANGCDSVATLHLVITPVVTGEETVTVCEAALPYSWNGTDYNAAGDYTATLTGANGCDSIATLHLVITPVVTGEETVTICEAALPYNWNGTDYNAAGDYTANLAGANGCDSIATLHLVITPVVTGEETVTICEAALPYNWNGTDYNAAGDYTATLTGANGCDSIATLHLVITPVVTGEETVTICEAALPYSWNGTDYNAAGDYTATLTGTNGCDSIATLHLVITPVVTGEETVTICEAALPYSWNGTDYNTAGDYTATLTGANGCDSVATLHLVITPVVTGEETVTICEVALPYSWNGTDYNAAGDYTATLTGANGCDSIATLHLIITPVVTGEETITICEAALPYSWNGTDYNTAGDYTATLTGANGCDSIATLHLVITPVVTGEETVTICEAALPYSWNGTDYNAAGDYTATLTGANGCDSIATLHLVITPIVTGEETVTICEAALPYSWNGTEYNAAGDYTANLTGANGCDSVATLHLIITPVVTGEETVTICEAALPYSWNGTEYNAAGDYTANLTGANGCDSVATLHLVITPVVTGEETVTICEAALPYSWNGTDYNAAGDYTATLTGANGCDSIATLHLVITPVVTGEETVTICEVALPYSWNGTDYNAAGDYTATLTGTNGCDSIATLHLVITPVVTGEETVTICEAALPYSWNGTDYNTAGDYTATLTGANGCDSVATLHLVITPVVTGEETVTICEVALPYSWNGTDYNAAGDYTATLTGANGCDSIATLHLIITPVVTGEETITICEAALPYSWNGTDYNAAGDYTANLTGANGCDSIATLHLVITPVVTGEETVTICEAALPYSWNGTDYNTAGDYTATLTGANGCDSIATLHLVITPVVTGEETVTICEAALPYSWNGADYNAAGDYTATLTSANGCDSIATLHLVITPIVTGEETVTICEAALPYSWNGADYNAAGDYTATLTSANGCDSIATLHLVITPIVTGEETVTICEAALPYSWNGTDYNAAGDYTANLTGANGCDSVATLHLIITPVVTGEETVTVCEVALPYSWNGTDYNAAGDYTATLTGANGCDSIATLHLVITPVVTGEETVTICEAALPYSWNGTDYNAAGDYTATLTGANGCDSVATLHLVITPVVTGEETVTICEAALPYSWNGTDYNAAGDYTATLTGANGCDSIATLHLVITPVVTGEETVTICEAALPYNWNGTDYNAAGDYTATLTGTNGCDSIATLHLVITPVVTGEETVTICEAALPYSWNGTEYNAAGDYTATLTGANGCDSIATLHLVITPVVTGEETVTVCEAALPYSWNGTDYNAVGDYTATLTGANGCDSIATLHLVITPVVTGEETITICEAALPYSWNGSDYNAAGDYTATLTGANGCDSIATLHLVITPVVTGEETVTICEAALPYNWNGTDYNAAGDYTANLTGANGCDSIATLHLVITPVVTGEETVTICEAALPYSWNGTEYNAAGDYTATLTGANGCDSVATLHLIITPVVTGEETVTVCEVALPYSWNGTDYNAAGDYTATLTGANGCDSIATLHLVITPVVTGEETVTICEAALPYSWNATDYNAAGDYTATLTGANGCDSIATLHLVITAVVTGEETVTVCEAALPYNWNGTDYNAAGDYTATLTGANGCDSVATLHLVITLVVTGEETVTICEAALPYSWNGTDYNAAGDYTATLTGANGCDSIATLHLVITPVVTGEETVTVCEVALPYSWNGTDYNAAGDYTATLTGANGCDSIATLHLVITPVVTGEETVTICEAALPYSWNGTEYNAAGDYTATLTGANGCDSIATLHLVITPVVTGEETVTICEAALPYSWNGTDYNAAGDYTATLTGANGCDSIATLHLVITPVVTGEETVTICEAALPYSWNGTEYNAAGDYTATLTGANGCDSIATLHLVITPVVTGEETVTICEVALPYSWNGTDYNAAGDYTATLTGTNGCDSIATLHLVITPVVTGEETVTICEAALPYSWNGTDYNTAGDYTATLTGANGCDSVATLHLVITPVVTGEETVTICEVALPYSWNGTDYNAAGDYTATLTGANGCDSIATLHLIITPVVTGEETITICEAALPYSWNGTDYNAAGDYTANLTGANGCDSIATLHLVITPVVTGEETVTICEAAQPYSWNGTDYNTAGDYTATLTGANGCDSIATLHLVITPVVTGEETVTICEAALPYSWNGADYNAAGDYTATLTSANGCDSIATLHLVITPIVTGEETVTICEAALPYSWNGADYNAAGDYTATLTSANGCDSIATLHLVITPIVTGEETVTICEAALPYSWNGTDYNAAGDYTANLTGANGCDSVATLHLIITPVVTGEETVTVCEVALPYSWNGTDYNAAGDYTATLTGANGCDSIATLHLVITPVVTGEETVTICEAALPYSWNGTDYNAAGDYTATLTGANGCDSVATLHLVINPVVTGEETVTICEAALPYSWNGTDYNAAGDYTATLTGANGCDSVATLHLVITPVVTGEETVTICEAALPYSWNGTDYTAAGDYTATLTGANGCDSIATLHLIITPVVTGEETVTICEAALPYSWNGTDYNTAGDYTANLAGANGCDSIATLHLVITPVVTGEETITICEAALPYSWNNQSLSAAGDYTATLTGANGCDSIATLHLVITPVVTGEETITICEAALPYSWNGTDYNAAGDYTATLTGANGCDSIATLHLVITPVVTGEETITICEAALPYSWNGTDYNAAGDYTATLTAANGCDSIATLHLIITPVVTGEETVTVCEAALPYSWNNQSLSAAGDYIATLTSVDGCDSTATLHLVVNNIVTGEETITICEAALPYSWNGTDYNAAGDYTATLTGANGCDSIATLHLVITPVVTGEETITICEAALPYSWNGTDYNAAGDYTATLTGANGCDSIATLHLIITPIVTGEETITICEVALPYSWNGTDYNAAGDYTVTLTRANGCDSVATLHLVIIPVVTGEETVTVCEAALPYSWNNQSLSAAGDYTATLTSVAGCDSIATLHLVVNNIVTGEETITICEAALPYSWNNQSLTAAGDYTATLTSVAGCDSIVTLHLVVNNTVTGEETITICEAALPYSWNNQSLTAAGDYTATLTSMAGCDSTATLHLVVNNIVTGEETITICEAALPYSWNNQSLTAAGDYTATLTSVAGCDSIATLHLVVNNIVTGEETITICEAALPYSWNNQSLTAAGDYTATLTSVDGCDSIATLHLVVNNIVTGEETITICEAALPYSWNNQSLTAAGDYTATLTSMAGCDSIATLHLVVNNIVTGEETITICEAALPYSWNNQSLTAAGDYTATLTSVDGCDSIATLHLVVNNIVPGEETITICEAALPYSWNNQSLSAAGDYTATLTSVAGCDSIATLHLVVNNIVTGEETITICEAALPYSWNNQSLSAAGDYTATLTSAAGCDSIATLHLVVNNIVTGEETITICEAALPYSWNNQSLSAAGDYTATLTSVAGCDSIATLHLAVNNIVTGEETITICEAALPYSWNGTDYNAAGDYTATLTGANGCDSVATLHLIITPVVTGDETVTICEAALPYSWNGTDYNAAGDYTANLTGANGCDSIATLHLVITPVVTGEETVTVCETALPYSWNGTDYNAAGDYTANLTGANGCDSIATLHLVITPVVTGEETVTVCETALPYSWNGTDYNAAGDYTANLAGANGCDSIATLHLVITPVATGEETVTICEAALPYSWNGTDYNAAGDYTANLAGANGCDSIATLHLVITPVATGEETVTICEAALPYSWNGTDYNAAGDYTATLTGANGCDSVATLHLVITPVVTGEETVTVCEAALPYSWNNQSLTAAGDYTATLTSVDGCDSIATLHMVVNNIVTGEETITICEAALPYSWNNQSLSAAGDYTATLTSVAGCDSIATLHLAVNNIVTGEETITICEAVLPYSWNNQSLSAAGDYTATLTSVAGCDSIATLHLVVNNIVPGEETITICEAALPYSWNNQSLSAAGDYTATLTSVAGCDSIATLHLIVNNIVTGEETITICEAALPYSWNNQSLTAAGDYTATLTSVAGCDSIATLHLVVNNVVTGEETITICEAALPYSWNNQSLTAAGDYTATLTSVAGCDSIATLHLVVNNIVTSEETITICEAALPYSWNNQSLSAAGDYTATLTSAAGCDSIATLHLVVNNIVTGEETITICEDALPYSWNNQSLSAAGDYTATLTSVAGCDSIATLHLAVNNIVTGEETITICEAALPYSWNGTDYNAAGDYTATLTGANGCDSIATLHLVITPVVTGEETITVCEAALPYSWNGTDYNTAGDYTATLTGTNGCDSVATLHLIITAVVTGEETVTICEAALPYSWNGTDYNAAGDYTANLTGTNGCDSVATLHLVITPVVTGEETVTVCEAALPYSWNNQSLTVAGDYTATLTSVAGCDSIATLHLVVNNIVTGEETITICEAALPYSWNNQSLTAAGDYTATLTSVAGCDSIATLHLVVNNIVTGEETITICEAALPYSWNNQSLTAAGDYTATLTSMAGCDSIATLHLVVNNIVTGEETITICEAALPYSWNNQSLTAAGDYTATLTSMAGCDSTATLHLVVNTIVTGEETITICEAALPYSWNGTDYNAAGDYTATLTGANGCDSIATLHLIITTVVTGEETITICEVALPYSWNGTDYNAAGDYTVTLTGANGCDSVATLHLVITPVVTGEETVTVCEAALPYSWNNQSLSAAGDYTATLTSVAGCDSIATLHLIVNNIVTGEETITICEAALPYSWNNQSLTAAGDYTATLTSVAGCDSIATLHLVVNNVVTGEETITICEAALPYSWNNQSLTAAGDYTATLTSVAGCDSIATLHLVVNNIVTSEETITICEAALPYSWNNQSLSAAGDYTATLTSAAGCDSIATLHLVVNNIVTGEETITICEDALPYSWNNQSLSAAGDYTATLTSVAGCDSIATLHLVVNNIVTGEETITICEAALPYSWNNQSLTAAGDYTATLTSVAGCDSTATLHLVVNNIVTGEETITICEAALPYSWNNQSLTAAGDYTATLTSVAGCDSIATLHLVVNNIVTGEETITICEAALPYSWNNQSLTAAGDYTATLTSVDGCDSIATLHLVVNNIVTGEETITICETALPYNWNNQSLTAAGDYTATLTSVAGCDSITTLHLVVNNIVTGEETITICGAALPYSWNNQSLTVAGDYTATLTSVAGCDSIATLHLVVNNIVTGEETITICEAALPYSWNNQSLTAAGDYTATLTSVAGCDSIATLHLVVNNIVTGEETITICEATLPYSWNNQSLTAAGDYTATLTSVAGCDSTATLHLVVNNTVTGEETITICEAALPYSWNHQSLTAAGDYTATLTSVAGCDSIATLHLVINPVVTSTTSITICSDQLPYSWNGQTYIEAGSYEVNLTSSTSCDSIASLILNISPLPPIPVVAATRITCETTTGTITITSPSPGNGITYSIDGVNFQASNVFTGVNPGEYTVSVRNVTGCTSSTTVTVIQINNTMALDQTVTNATCTSNTGSINLVVSNGAAPFAFAWTGPNLFAASTEDLTNLAPGTYQVTVTDANGCKANASATINQADILPNVVTNPVTLCSPANLTDPSVTAGSDTGLTFTYWMDVNATNAIANPTAVYDGTYYIEGTNAFGCSTIKPVTVKIEPSPKFIVTNPPPVCSPAAVDLTDPSVIAGSDPGWFLTYWQDAAATIPLVNASAVDMSGTYYIKASAVGGCSSVQLVQVTVIVNESTGSMRYPTITTSANVAVQLNARTIGNNSTYLWTPPTALNSNAVKNPTFRHDKSIEYTIKIDNGNNCPVVDTVLVLIRPANSGCTSDIFVPKAWSPNLDGHNDRLYPLPVCIKELKYFRIFNRWGQLMFETNILGHGWDGMFKGAEQVMDVYTWTLEATGEDGRHFKRAGNSVLLR